MAHTSIPNGTNLALATFLVAAFAGSVIVMPVLWTGHWAGMIVVTLLLAPLNTPLWSLIHEAIHKNFHSNKRVNEIGGRVMSIIFGACFGVLRFGHLMHHRYNRDWESEYYTGNKLAAWAGHYFKMLGGLYLTEVAMSFFLALSPAPLARKVARRIFEEDSHYRAVLNSLLKPENIRKIRTDCLWIVFFYSVVFLAFQPDWIVAVIALSGRGFVISIMDNAYHYGTPRDGSVVAKELKTHPVLSRFILNFNHHMTHHRNVGLPWPELAQAHKIQDIEYHEGLGRALKAQFKGPVALKEK